MYMFLLKSWRSVVRICLILCVAALLPVCCGSGNHATGTTITFNVTVPSGSLLSGGTVTLAGSMDGWNPLDSAWIAKKIDDTHFRIVTSLDSPSVAIAAGDTIQYRWTMQLPGLTADTAWTYAEGTVTGADISNRSYTVTGGDNTINDTVAAFRNNAGAHHTVVDGSTLGQVILKLPALGVNRNIRVWLPAGYDSAGTKEYSVIYMHDAQNLFDDRTAFTGEWHVDEAVQTMISTGFAGSIVVGIDNSANRFNELSPDWTRSSIGSPYITKPVGDKYAADIVSVIKPYIDAHYHTAADRAHTGIGGSSMGGIESLYMALEYPAVFGYALIFSPALQVYADGTVQRYIASKDFSDTSALPKIYLYAGGAIGGSAANTPYDETLITPFVSIIENALTTNGYTQANIDTMIDAAQPHSETAWSKYFPAAYAWLVGYVKP